MTERDIQEHLGLSTEQSQALRIEEDTLLLAGAGAGKTTTLLGALLGDLLLRQLDPSAVAVATFTRSAADVLRSRLQEALYELGEDIDVDRLWIGTIDAIAARVVRTRGLHFGQNPDITPAREEELLPLAREALLDFAPLPAVLGDWAREDDLLRILMEIERSGVYPRASLPPLPDQEGTLRTMRELLGELSLDTQITALEKDIGRVERGVSPGDGVWGIRKKALLPLRDEAREKANSFSQALLDQETWPIREAIVSLYEQWQERWQGICRREGKMTFRNIMVLAESLATEPFLRRAYIDEAQDTSAEQYRFLRSLLAGPLISVGDPNQSIYTFRGADLENFLQQTEGVPRIVLRDNYRSAPEILDTVEEVCRPLLGESLLPMRPASDASGEVASFLVQGSREEEASALADILSEELLSRAADDIAVLFRSNSDLDYYYDYCLRRELPVAALRSGGLLQQEECQDLLALLRYVFNPLDEGSLLRVLSSPMVSLGADELLDWSGRIGEAAALVPELRELGEMRDSYPLSDIAETARHQFALDARLLFLDPSGARQNHIDQFIRLLRRSEAHKYGWMAEQLLADLPLLLREEETRFQPRGVVHMQTIHRAKGGEYPVIILPGMHRKAPTSSRKKIFFRPDGEIGIALRGGRRDSVASEGEKEALSLLGAEERRLIYVAMTRAEERLLLLAREPLQGAVESLPHLSPLPSPASQRSESGGEEESDPELPSYSPDLPPPLARRMSWSTLSSWNRCSLRRHLEGEWGLRGEQSSGGEGKRQLGIEVHEALARKNPEGLSAEGREMFDRGQVDWQEGAESEKSFALPIGEWIIRGRVDLCRWEDREAHLVDWKTGEEEDFGEDYLLQRKIYALAFLQSGARRVRAETVYLRSGEREGNEWSDAESLREDVQGEIERILRLPPEPAATSPEPFCAGCPGRLALCPVSREIQILEQDHQTHSDESSLAE